MGKFALNSGKIARVLGGGTGKKDRDLTEGNEERGVGKDSE